jgi:hypothetical protein
MPPLGMNIDRLTLELPGGDGETAVELVRLVAQRLSGTGEAARGETDHVRVEVDAPLPPGETLDDLAGRIARELLSQMAREA